MTTGLVVSGEPEGEGDGEGPDPPSTAIRKEIHGPSQTPQSLQFCDPTATVTVPTGCVAAAAVMVALSGVIGSFRLNGRV